MCVRKAGSFESMAEQYPERTALIYENQKMTYQELRLRSHRIGSLLYQDGQCVCKNQRVAIIMEKGWEQIVAVLGILVAGCAYVPIDASLPSERIQFILDDAGIDVIMTQKKFLGQEVWMQSRIIIDVTTKANYPMEEGIIALPQKQEELAYIIYTSGSTGTPKGVMIRHDGLANVIESTIEKFQITKKDACINITNLHHDMSVFDIFGMLCTGGCVIVPNEWQRKNPADLANMIQEYQVTIWNSVPSIIDVYVDYLEYNKDQIPQSLKTVFLGGDWIKVKTCEKLFSYIKGLQIVGVGGPTETTLWNIWNPFNRVEKEWTSVPYGVPINNTKYYVLNERLEDCPTWVAGNICSTGVGTTKGYVNDQGMYAKHFANHPLTGELLFISGDRGRYLPDGRIEFLGREDNQIKINGLRIELGEIEQVLKGLKVVEDAKVLRKKIDGEKEILVAYMTSKQQKIDEEQIALELEKKLPKYMIPTKYIVLDAMPVTRNNKIDTLYLENLLFECETDKEDTHSNEIEDDILVQITQIVKDVLKTNRVDPDTELSKLGANSLELIRIINRLERELKYRIGIEEFYKIYYYHPKKHRLFCITKDGEVTRDIHWTSNKDIFDQAAFSVFFISQYDAIGPMYGEQGFDFLRIEAGEMSQILESYGRECNIGFCQIGNTDFEKVRNLFQLDPSHIYIHAMLGGGLLDEKKENELDTYYVEIEQEMSKGTQSRNVTELQKRVQLEDETTDVYCLIRAASNQKAQERILESLKKWEVTIPGDKLSRIHAIAGDIGKDYFGISREVYDQLLENIHLVIHNAAWVNWSCLQYFKSKNHYSKCFGEKDQSVWVSSEAD